MTFQLYILELIMSVLKSYGIFGLAYFEDEDCKIQGENWT